MAVGFANALRGDTVSFNLDGSQISAVQSALQTERGARGLRRELGVRQHLAASNRVQRLQSDE